jgi:hypothetical protein
MKERKYNDSAKMFCDAIKALANNPTALDNLECYLANCFGPWLEKYANTPEWIAREMHEFSTIEF